MKPTHLNVSIGNSLDPILQERQETEYFVSSRDSSLREIWYGVTSSVDPANGDHSERLSGCSAIINTLMLVNFERVLTVASGSPSFHGGDLWDEKMGPSHRAW